MKQNEKLRAMLNLPKAGKDNLRNKVREAVIESYRELMKYCQEVQRVEESDVIISTDICQRFEECQELGARALDEPNIWAVYAHYVGDGRELTKELMMAGVSFRYHPLQDTWRYSENEHGGEIVINDGISRVVVPVVRITRKSFTLEYGVKVRYNSCKII